MGSIKIGYFWIEDGSGSLTEGGWKVPPKAKIYEALTAVADGRVNLKGGETAEVLSSDGTKTYIVNGRLICGR